MIFIDTDVLWLEFAFHHDGRRATNTIFLQQVQASQPATTIYNVLELLGKLSFNVAPNHLDQWQTWLVDFYQLFVIWPLHNDLSTESAFREEIFERPYHRMRTFKIPFMDSLILNLAERTPTAGQFVTWNARSFQGKTTLQVLTPEEYLMARNSLN